MRWQQIEFLLKGVLLGLFVYLAVFEPPATWNELGHVGIVLGIGIVSMFLFATALKLREGHRFLGQPVRFFLFVLLDSPGAIYAGTLLGAMIGIFTLDREPNNALLGGCVGGGAVYGLLLYIAQRFHRYIRFWLGFVLIIATVGVAMGVVNAVETSYPTYLTAQIKAMIPFVLLLGLPFYYLLTFTSLSEESESDIAAICSVIGVAFWFFWWKGNQDNEFKYLSMLFPIALYYVYTRNILPSVRVSKHLIRGVCYGSVGKFKLALAVLQRASEIDQKSELAQEALWDIHRLMDFDEVAKDSETLSLIDFEVCLQRSGSLLSRPPSAVDLIEARKLLDFAGQQHPELEPRCDYWRTVAFLHEKKFDEAAERLTAVLAEHSTDNPHQQVMAFSAWQLALVGHPEMKKRVGSVQIQNPKQKMEAIAAVERELAANPEDEAAWAMKRMLYADLREFDYDLVAPEGGGAVLFDHKYAEELGKAMMGDPTKWRRAVEFYRIAARGDLENAPKLYVDIAKISDQHGDTEGAWRHYELAKEVGDKVGPQNLSKGSRDVYFQVVKMLAGVAREDGDFDRAIALYRKYAEAKVDGRETHRILAELYEQKGDVWNALLQTEHGLTFGKDQDLFDKKDKYYYSVMPDDLRKRREEVQKLFDTDYCLQKSRFLLDKQGDDLTILDWSEHLLSLAQVMNPENLTVRVLRGRIKRARGENKEAIDVLEDVRTNKPDHFPSKDEEDSWYLACRVLGDMYLNNNPEKAIECFTEFRKSNKSGGDTYYKLGVAYESLGDYKKAKACYDQVLVWPNHPLAGQAQDGLSRLKQAVT
ncbi:MAG: tetratricopeptide repeat protein [Gemmataceae bacterium]